MAEKESDDGLFSPETLHVVFGCNGPVGVALMERLAERGVKVRGICRSGESEAPEGAEIVAGDATHRGEARRLAEDASVVYSTIGVGFGRWLELWPPIVEGLLDAAEAAGARLVFTDNLYCYGPQTVPLRPDMPMTTYGKKPALRARLAKRLLEAHRAGRVPVAMVRSSDFYGPGVLGSALGERVFPKALAGRPAQVLGDVDQPHTFTYVGDVARALVSVAGDDEALGEAWHVPNAPAVSQREVLEKVYRLAGREPRFKTLSQGTLRFLAFFKDELKELKELGYQWYRPFPVDHSKFAARFWDDPTPLDEGLEKTLEWYRQRGG